LGYAGRLGELARRRAGKAVPREQRDRRADDRLAALFAIEPGAGHGRYEVSAYLPRVKHPKIHETMTKNGRSPPEDRPLHVWHGALRLPPEKSPDPATRRGRYPSPPRPQPDNAESTDLSPGKRTYPRFGLTSPPAYPPAARAGTRRPSRRAAFSPRIARRAASSRPVAPSIKPIGSTSPISAG